MEKQWVVTAVGTENGKSVIFLMGPNGEDVRAPTSTLIMSKLAEKGVRVRNVVEYPRGKRS